MTFLFRKHLKTHNLKQKTHNIYLLLNLIITINIIIVLHHVIASQLIKNFKWCEHKISRNSAIRGYLHI